mgnify:CR=1 FL=1
MQKIKAITYGECPEPQIFKGIALGSRQIEQAGRGYEEFKLKMHMIKMGIFKEQKEETKSEEDDKDAEGEIEEGKIDEEKMKNKRKKRKASMNMKNNVNYYEVMGFDDCGEDFNEKQLKKKYMKLALKYHPDKMGKDYNEEAKKRWLKVRRRQFR